MKFGGCRRGLVGILVLLTSISCIPFGATFVSLVYFGLPLGSFLWLKIFLLLSIKKN